MNLTNLASGLVALSILILKVNTVSSYVFPFPEIKFTLFPQKFNLNDFISLFHVNMPDINSFKSLCVEELKHVVFSIDELASKLYEKINIFTENPDYFFSHFKVSKILLNWIRWHPDFSCSKFNASDLNFHIKNELFGQHIVSWFIPKLLNDHFTKDEPKKPLLISFQGPTGSGKSFLKKILIDSLFKDGFYKKFVHTYYGSLDFFNRKAKENYRKRLLHEIPFLLSLCDRSVIIFEEMDKMVPGVIDAILPFIYFSKNSTYDYSTKSVFIFISNSGTKKIEEIVYEAWLEGLSREDITIAKFSSCLKAALYNEPGGLQYSEIIKKNLIDMFLPFLPLERDHVKQCIIRELHLRKMPINMNIVEYIADQTIYYPPEFDLFAQSGCKRISQKIDLYSNSDL